MTSVAVNLEDITTVPACHPSWVSVHKQCTDQVFNAVFRAPNLTQEHLDDDGMAAPDAKLAGKPKGVEAV